MSIEKLKDLKVTKIHTSNPDTTILTSLGLTLSNDAFCKFDNWRKVNTVYDLPEDKVLV
jgi:hypothetical protein